MYSAASSPTILTTFRVSLVLPRTRNSRIASTDGVELTLIDEDFDEGEEESDDEDDVDDEEDTTLLCALVSEFCAPCSMETADVNNEDRRDLSTGQDM